MALDLAGPAMARTGVSLISDVGATVFVDRILTRLRGDTSTYFASLPTSPGLPRTMFAAVKALRLAGMSAEQISPDSFETPQKGREIVAVLNEYLKTLREKNLLDYADVLALATDELGNNPHRIDANTRILLPENIDLTGSEKSLVKALEPRCLITLPVDSLQTISGDLAESSGAIGECPHPNPLPEGEGASGSGASRNPDPTTKRCTCSDASLLAWVLQPAEAPQASQDGSAEIFHAVGECNEVREVLRRAVSNGFRLDEIELLHTDREVYVPLVYETLMQVLQDPKFDDASLPVTFAEGIPSTYSRPGRALVGWMEWMHGDFRQDTLAKMIEDGLLELPADSVAGTLIHKSPHPNPLPEGEGASGSGALKHGKPLANRYSRLAGIVRATPIGAGRDGYVPKLEARAAGKCGSHADKPDLSPELSAPLHKYGDEFLKNHGRVPVAAAGSVAQASLPAKLMAGRDARPTTLPVPPCLPPLTGGPRGVPLNGWRAGTPAPPAGATRTEDDAQTLLILVTNLLQVSPGPDIPAAELLRTAERFVQDVACKANELDNYAALALLDQIRELARWVEEDPAPLSLNTAEWLTTLPNRVRVGGSGPRPGCLHVDHLLSGGHSGRRHTFIIGMDDARFPGAGINDPLLLDHERERLSPELPKASSNLRRKLERFAQMCAGLRGKVTLGFSSLDLVEDRSLFPSSVVFSAYRILSNNREGDQGDMIRWLPSPASFAAENPERSLDPTEWWLLQLCQARVSNAREILHRSYPHLGRGAKAALARGSDAFTIYDGRLPDPPEDLNPFSPTGPVISSSRLETIGQCPLRYFFKYVLKIEPPDEISIDPGRWLDPLQFGNLMHEVFYRFMSDVIEKRVRPRFERDKFKLLGILTKQVERFADLYPPPGPSAFRRQLLMLIQASVIFLVEEELLARQSWPVFLEASIGMPAYGKPCDLDMEEPMLVSLPGGAGIRARARIDRVDILGDGTGRIFAIWDYKTGSTMRYDDPDPFQQGRIIQHALYLEIVARALRKKVASSATVSHFGYFFPGSRSSGVRIIRRPHDRDTALWIMEKLCTTVADGCFLATNDFKKDCTFCDYTAICDDLEATAAASARKLENTENADLESIRELRNLGNKA